MYLFKNEDVLDMDALQTLTTYYLEAENHHSLSLPNDRYGRDYYKHFKLFEKFDAHTIQHWGMISSQIQH